MTPFRINTPDDTLEQIRQRLTAFDPVTLPRRPGWRCGTDPTALEELTRYWLTDYDWRRHERELNAFEQFTAAVDGVEVHLLHEPGSGTAPPTVLLLHGWPTSFATFRAVISRLAHPETAGGDPEDGLTVVVPSLPGYGFSPPTSAPIGVRSAGHLFHRLLTEVLGEARYYVHGGDQGAPIAEWMAFDHPDHCSGLHTTLLGVRHDGAPLGSGLTGVEDPTADEILFVQREHNLTCFTEPPRGGHFPSLEAPDVFAADLAGFIRATESSTT
ncbi:epoxide hydrolase family protein [Parafrankia soli]|uniref:epoxide hydrolase family protein n=1 Tax=Parafrankia soli TaxID=2599596 RepID=UPI000AC0DE04|nr:epoxide hydrolase [Parafrankia soli]